MLRRFNPSAAQTALLIVLGSLLVACGFLVLAPHFPHGSSRNRAQLAICPVLFAIGFPLWLKSTSSLKDGIRTHRWPPEQIESIRTILQSPLLLALPLASVILICILTYAMLVFHSGWGILWPALILSQTLTHLQQAVQRPSPPRPAAGWRNFSRIRSQHWGEK